MAKTFLGKPVPVPRKEAAPFQPGRFSWVLYVFGPLAIAGAILYLGSFQSPAPFSGMSLRNLGSARLVERAYAAGATYANPCAYSKIRNTFNMNTIFPLLPTSINPPQPTPNPTTNLIPQQDPNKCSPVYWNADVMWVLAYKALALLNYVAYALAVILTIYAGLMYLSGFANEANAKKGKTILIATYVGLALVMLSRLIVYGTYQVLTNKAADPNTVDPVNITVP